MRADWVFTSVVMPTETAESVPAAALRLGRAMWGAGVAKRHDKHRERDDLGETAAATCRGCRFSAGRLGRADGCLDLGDGLRSLRGHHVRDAFGDEHIVFFGHAIAIAG